MAPKYNDETEGCVFQWKIVNVSHCWLKHGQRIESPAFIADGVKGTKWSLWLYPKGGNSENQVEFFLYRHTNCNGPSNLHLNYQIAFLGKDGSFLKKTALILQENFEKGSGFGFLIYETQENVFITQKELFLPEDTLTVECKFWSKGKNLIEPKHLYASTVYIVNRRRFNLRIEKFSIIKSEIINKFKDQLIEFDLALNEGMDFGKKLVLNFNTFKEDLKYFSFKTSIVNSEGIKEDCGTHEYFLDDLKKGVLSTLLFTKKLIENKSRFLPSDVLSLDFEYVCSNGLISYEYCCSGIISAKSRNEVNESRKECDIAKEDSLNTAELGKDLKLVYNDGILSDVELRTSTKSFPAHKIILSARSPVFKSMFSNDMKERSSGHVDITDIEDDIIHRMLLYVYTDSLEDLQIESVSKLYAVADKYQILSLKSRCASFFKENLCLTQACDVLILADRHNDDDLKNGVHDYLLRQQKQFFCSQEWENFMNTHIKLAADVMRKKIFQE